MDAVTPARSPPGAQTLRGGQALVRYVNEDFYRAWRWIPPGVEFDFTATTSYPGILHYQVGFLTGVSLLRYVIEYRFQGPPCGLTAALRKSSRLLLSTAPSPLRPSV